MLSAIRRDEVRIGCATMTDCPECARNDPLWETFRISCKGCRQREWAQTPYTLRRALKIAPEGTRQAIVDTMALVRQAIAIAALPNKEDVSTALRSHYAEHGKDSAERLKAEVVWQRQQRKEQTNE